jgi:hypothetical protein
MKTAMTLALVCLWPTLGFAGEISSAYTTYNLDKCKRISAAEEQSSGEYICKGYHGNDIYWAEGDLRTSIAYGKNPKNHCSVRQGFAGFNSVDSTVEWRLENGKPFAAIQRWRVSYDPDDAEKVKTWLAVTRLEKGNSCRVALIEGAVPNANEKAREAADKLSRTFNCKTDKAKVFNVAPSTYDPLEVSSPCPTE